MRTCQWRVGWSMNGAAVVFAAGVLAAPQAQAPNPPASSAAPGDPQGAVPPGGAPRGGRGPQEPALVVAPLADAVAVAKYPPLNKTGNFKIAPATTWADVPAMTTPEAVPKGTVTMFTMKSEDTQM